MAKAASHFRNQEGVLALLSRDYVWREPHSANHPVRLRRRRKRTPLHGGEITTLRILKISGTGKPVPYGAIEGLGRAGGKVKDKGKNKDKGDKENDPSERSRRSALQ